MAKYCVTALVVTFSSVLAAPTAPTVSSCQFTVTNSAGQDFTIMSYEDIVMNGKDYEVQGILQPTLANGGSQSITCSSATRCAFSVDQSGAVMCPPVEATEKHYFANCGETVDISSVKSHEGATNIIIGECKTSLDYTPPTAASLTTLATAGPVFPIVGTLDCTLTNEYATYLGNSCSAATDCCAGQNCKADGNGNGFCA